MGLVGHGVLGLKPGHEDLLLGPGQFGHFECRAKIGVVPAGLGTRHGQGQTLLFAAA